MTIEILVNTTSIHTLDISVAKAAIAPLLSDRDTLLANEQQLTFAIDYPREDTDPRELSEIPEIRLWFIRLDTMYPWLPFILDWKAGELARYTAMLVPHQFHRTDGIQYNPESLEIFVMHKTLTLINWMQEQGIERRSRLKAMTQMLGYELDDGFFDLIEA
ncbi:CRR6 family NdhI maturation factor [Roseofilum casamattae]|uniref:CRR6 family NdhI maturation factor n=1 Tax=Roseofilum casamattae BLCC-M143 TaxID=3022442 RepID=A0ABT7BZ81_9CYAN|nr:CRR6 family NdhI maturation factor [Roseofilum casamattae]MDJ1184471.1 CRR6 family NdhI maturation factor [Roseofilum casamattae BLCC-M143]